MWMWTTKKNAKRLADRAYHQGVQEIAEHAEKHRTPAMENNNGDILTFLDRIQDPSFVEALREAGMEPPNTQKHTTASRWRALKESVSIYVTSVTAGISFEQARLNRMQKRAAEMYREDPLIRSVGNLVLRSVLGGGVSFGTGNADIDAFLDTYWGKQGSNLAGRIREITLHRYLMGEYFLVYFISSGKLTAGEIQSPKVTVRRFYPWEIQNLIMDTNDDEVINGVIRAPSDGGKSRIYRTIYAYLDPSGWPEAVALDAEPDVYVQYIKLGDGFDVRGYPQILVMMKWATIIREMLFDVSQKFHEWSKVLFTLNVKRRDKDLSADTGWRAPKGGTVLVNSEDADWGILESHMDSAGIETVWKTLMYYFSAGAGYPYQYIVHDYSNNNLASSREARQPVIQLVREQQDSLEEEITIMLRVGLQAGVNAGILPATISVPVVAESARRGLAVKIYSVLSEVAEFNDRVIALSKILREAADMKMMDTTRIPINILFPQTSALSEKEQAEVLEIYSRIGIDQRTIAETGGFDWDVIMARKLAEIDFQAQLSQKRADLAGIDPDTALSDDLAGDA